jgi:DNA-binding NtrC family response regulator
VNLLLVEDDPLEARLLKANLGREPRIQVEVVSSAEKALERLRQHAHDAVITDLVLPKADGIELVRRVRLLDPTLPVFVLTAYASLELAVEGVRAGAADFLAKPLDPELLLVRLEQALRQRTLRAGGRRGDPRAKPLVGDILLGDHPRLDDVRHLAGRIARVPGARLLITGESGTGKSLLARAIHMASGVEGQFVEVNCAALPANLLESELFGHERGAFTDAKEQRRGLIELAQNGTLFLDEIGALPLDLQAKLLLFLEKREIRRIGGARPIEINTRVIAATNDDLRQKVGAGAFRPDLFYRLDVTSIEMPPLREIVPVIPRLAEQMLRELAAGFSLPVPPLTETSFAELLDYPWPGNVRELRNAVERALIVYDGGSFEVKRPSGSDLPLGGRSGIQLEHGLTLAEVERRYIEAMLESNRHRDLGEIARRMGISRKTLWEKRRRYALDEQEDPKIA